MDLAKVVVGALLTLVFWIGVAAGGGSVFVFDRHPAWSFTVPAPVRWVLPARWKHPVFVGLAAERDKAVAAARNAQDGQARCLASLSAQNASIALLGQESAQRLAKAERAVSDAQAIADGLRRSSVALRAYQPKGADRCAEWDDADRAVLSALN